MWNHGCYPCPSHAAPAACNLFSQPTDVIHAYLAPSPQNFPEKTCSGGARRGRLQLRRRKKKEEDCSRAAASDAYNLSVYVPSSTCASSTAKIASKSSSFLDKVEAFGLQKSSKVEFDRMLVEEQVVARTCWHTEDGKSSDILIKKEKHKDKRKNSLMKEAEKADRRGVCYLSRLPPHMNPLKLRQILSEFGEIQRIYLAPEVLMPSDTMISLVEGINSLQMNSNSINNMEYNSSVAGTSCPPHLPSRKPYGYEGKSSGSPVITTDQEISRTCSPTTSVIVSKHSYKSFHSIMLENGDQGRLNRLKENSWPCYCVNQVEAFGLQKSSRVELDRMLAEERVVARTCCHTEDGKSSDILIKKEKQKDKRKKSLMNEAEKADRRGVCYLSRLPPHMNPLKLRQILSEFGEIQRIYLAPEDAAAQVRRKKSGGFPRKEFSEGWVEFTEKIIAKRVAKMLNCQQIGGKKRSSFYYDLWNIKYLSKFKWDDLTEEIATKNATREQKLALELSAAKRERDFYLSKVDQSIALSKIEERLKKKQKVEMKPKVIRWFPQKKPAVNEAGETKELSRDILAGPMSYLHVEFVARFQVENRTNVSLVGRGARYWSGRSGPEPNLELMVRIIIRVSFVSPIVDKSSVNSLDELIYCSPDFEESLEVPETKAEMMQALKERKAQSGGASSSRKPSKEKRKEPLERKERRKKRRNEEMGTKSARVTVPKDPSEEQDGRTNKDPEQQSTEEPYILLDTSAISFVSSPSGPVSLDFIRLLIPDRDFDQVKQTPDLKVLETAGLHFMQTLVWFGEAASRFSKAREEVIMTRRSMDGVLGRHDALMKQLVTTGLFLIGFRSFGVRIERPINFDLDDITSRY
ncbi:hypothetical protein F511_06441 [Dorcoceras hygrometricum]|uniref:RRM domain-containing protein n=1 Tax=Dorcoceras hygrometricum TaxID=472368 RepID=A0A2Z7ARY9_9LAMI|nr:hypothetical protein F511_06441 [Dorcoceras hygrometricum]